MANLGFALDLFEKDEGHDYELRMVVILIFLMIFMSIINTYQQLQKGNPF